MINYFEMKRNEWKVKATFYGMIAGLMDNQKDIVAALENLHNALQDDTLSNQVSSDTTGE